MQSKTFVMVLKKLPDHFITTRCITRCIGGRTTGQRDQPLQRRDGAEREGCHVSARGTYSKGAVPDDRSPR